MSWVNGELATSFDTLTKTEDVAWYNTDSTDVIAFELVTEPGYYLISNATVHVLYGNVAEFDWGAIDVSGIGGNINLGDDMVISHVSEFGGSTDVPAPGVLGLLGIGLLGLGAFARRRLTA
ncbi:MAG: PEP-CTERM sorting domain-containing protein [Halofilum sp. (in: g-proteobacteria)]|nr:PEP-CTERM sorting domain-containing protein [Halofilum sp. (in: g-proteobacteria)]